MPEQERQRLVAFPPPPAPGTRMRQALDLRIIGRSYAEIADEMGVSIPTAHQYVTEAIERVTADEVRHADLARQMMLLRLDALLRAQWKKATAGDERATAAALKILERQSKLLGLDAPARIDITARIRQMAIEEGLDPDEAVEEARRIVKARPW
jgi:hypothetical protein